MVLGRICFALLAMGAAMAAQAENLRVALYNAELFRAGPGLLLRDILKGDDQVEQVAGIIAHLDPDAIVLLRFDYDLTGAALAAFADQVAAAGSSYPHRIALRPNTGWATGIDMDGDGRTGTPADGQSFGQFAGQNGMAVLSKLPIATDDLRDYSDLLWRDLPGATLPQKDGAPFPSAAALDVQRLSTVGHWEVPLRLPSGRTLRLLTFHAGPPVFDGAEDRNGLRNRDELRFWSLLLDGRIDGLAAPESPFVLVGGANVDPVGGEGLRDGIAGLLDHPALQDPAPDSRGGALAGQRPPRIARHDTVAWDLPGEPGNLRVDYILPQAGLTVTGSGVFWPAGDEPDAALLGIEGRGASRHRLVWVDLDIATGP